jgi:hypothetical protein
VLTDNWNVQFTFTKNTSDPNGFVWSAVPGPPGSIAITTPSPLPAAKVGTAYTETLTAAGGTTAISWKAAKGGLPKGLKLSKTGAISGTVTKATEVGSYTVTITITNKAKPKATYTGTFALKVNPA